MLNQFLLKRPLITEKTTFMNQKGKYVFLVADAANKSEVKKIVEKEYKVHVTQVNIINARPKARRRKGRVAVKPGFKKAIVTLKAGEKLDIVPQ